MGNSLYRILSHRQGILNAHCGRFFKNLRISDFYLEFEKEHFRLFWIFWKIGLSRQMAQKRTSVAVGSDLRISRSWRLACPCYNQTYQWGQMKSEGSREMQRTARWPSRRRTVRTTWGKGKQREKPKKVFNMEQIQLSDGAYSKTAFRWNNALEVQCT